jgi:hypothetical protein
MLFGKLVGIVENVQSDRHSGGRRFFVAHTAEMIFPSRMNSLHHACVRRSGVTDQIHILEGMQAIKATRRNIRVIDRARLEYVAAGATVCRSRSMLG